MKEATRIEILAHVDTLGKIVERLTLLHAQGEISDQDSQVIWDINESRNELAQIDEITV
jgi:hypothetical protein